MLLVASAAALSVPHKPSTIFNHLSATDSSLLTTFLAHATNGTRIRLGAWGDWPALPFRPPIGELALDIDVYGLKANVPRFSTIILDSIENIIHKLDSGGRPLDPIGLPDGPEEQREIISYNGLVRVNFGCIEPEGRPLTRLEGSEILANIWDLTVKYGPREIVLANIEELITERLIGLFRLWFPGPV